MPHRKSFKALLAFAVTSLLCAAPLPAQEPPSGSSWSEDPASHCQFVSPRSLPPGPTYWAGACNGNKASGLGMLRRRDGDHVGPAFYGEMKNGMPVTGVIDNNGYRAGQFGGGDIGSDTNIEPQTRLDAFRVAAKAARTVAARYAGQGNGASSRHYEEIARQLDMQLD